MRGWNIFKPSDTCLTTQTNKKHKRSHINEIGWTLGLVVRKRKSKVSGKMERGSWRLDLSVVKERKEKVTQMKLIILNITQ